MEEVQARMAAICNSYAGCLRGASVSMLDLLLNEDTKELILRSSLSDKEIANIISSAVREIDKGSMKTVDALVKVNLLR